MILSRFFELFERHGGYKTGQLKLKKPKQLQQVLDIARYLLADMTLQSNAELEEKRPKLEQLKSVLEMYVFELWWGGAERHDNVT